MAAAVLFLYALGLTAIYSVSLSRGSGLELVWKQLTALCLGLLLAGLVLWSNYRWVKSYSSLLYAAAVLLLFLVLFFGQTIRGTTGWFSFFDLHFQPIEFVKPVIIICLAKYFSERSGGLSWRKIVGSGALVALPVILTLCQPDLGSMFLLIGLWLLFLFFAGLRTKTALTLLSAAVVVFFVFWQFLFADYQKARLLSFINPASDLMGEGYNVRQAIIAVGSGGLFGRGLGFGSQSQLRFIPESQTDFIFAVIAEEFGFLGVSLLLVAFLLLFYRLFQRARATRDDFTSFLFSGAASLFLISFVVNIGMNLGLLPVTGITLPFVSYGGSSLVISLLLIGLIESAIIHDVSVRSKEGVDT